MPRPWVPGPHGEEQGLRRAGSQVTSLGNPGVIFPTDSPRNPPAIVATWARDRSTHCLRAPLSSRGDHPCPVRGVWMRRGEGTLPTLSGHCCCPSSAAFYFHSFYVKDPGVLGPWLQQKSASRRLARVLEDAQGYPSAGPQFRFRTCLAHDEDSVWSLTCLWTFQESEITFIFLV